MTEDRFAELLRAVSAGAYRALPASRRNTLSFDEVLAVQENFGRALDPVLRAALGMTAAVPPACRVLSPDGTINYVNVSEHWSEAAKPRTRDVNALDVFDLPGGRQTAFTRIAQG
jgi:hypothetical protein